MPLEVNLPDKLIHTAWSMYSCNVTARGGMKVYGYTRCAVTMFGLECMLHLTLEFAYKQLADVMRFCFDQVSPTDEVQFVVFGVFWKAA